MSRHPEKGFVTRYLLDADSRGWGVARTDSQAKTRTVTTRGNSEEPCTALRYGAHPFPCLCALPGNSHGVSTLSELRVYQDHRRSTARSTTRRLLQRSDPIVVSLRVLFSDIPPSEALGTGLTHRRGLDNQMFRLYLKPSSGRRSSPRHPSLNW